MPHVSKAELMRYCRVDDEDNAATLLELADAAEDYLTTAGAQRTDETARSYDLAVKGLALHWFEHPEGGEFSPGLRAQINQLKFYRGG